MPPETNNMICVCGAGTMGAGIAQVAATYCGRTILYDIDESKTAFARTEIERSLSVLESKQKIAPGEKERILSNVIFTNDLSVCRADVVIEAIVENPDAKVSLFSRLAAQHSADTIFATNTSSLSISSIARGVPHPGRVIGMHFFNPAVIMKLVEIVQGPQTEPAVVARIKALALQMQKTPVLCNDAPGFIVNRVARHFYLEALRIAAASSNDIRLIDNVMENAGFRMGPFQLMDLIGNDVNLAVTRSLYEAYGRPERLRPAPLQEEKVRAGELGRKTARGFYQY